MNATPRRPVATVWWIAWWAGLLLAEPARAIDSQATGIVEPLAAEVRQVFACGKWAEPGRSGFYRIVLVDVSFGTGTEIYVQPIEESIGRSGASLKVLDTTPIRELNNDHAQYQVSSATCVGTAARSAVDLVATFEHDEGDVRRRIRVLLKAPGSYPVRNTVVAPRGKRP